MRLSRLLLLAGLLGWSPLTWSPLSGPVPTQDNPAGSRIERFQSYLERSPYHDKVFRGLVDAAQAAGDFDRLLDDYRRQVERRPQDPGPRVVLARLLAEGERWTEAAAQLQAVHPPTARARRLMARMYSRAGQLSQALETLDSALDLAEGPELVRELHLERADLFLARGDGEGARGAYAAVAELAQGNYADLYDIAGLMADAGFPADGVALLEGARALVVDDVPRTAKLLAEIGRLRERTGEGRAALAAYDEALPLLRQGHWLRKDLLARSLDLHRRAGTLGQAASKFRIALAQDPGDLEARLALVEALGLDRRPREALDQLRQATDLMPRDLDLSDRYARELSAQGQRSAYLRELQRALELAPRNERRRFELGAAFAAGGQLEAAEREWTRLIQAGGGDPARADRVAREWQRLGESERAARVWRAAIERAPGQVRRYGDLAQLLRKAGQPAAARQVLGQAERAVAGQAGALDELAEYYLAAHDPRSARRVLESALALDSGASVGSRLGRLAQANADLGDRRGARTALARWLDLAQDQAQRSAAMERYYDQLEANQRPIELDRLIQRCAGRDPRPSDWLLLAYFQRASGARVDACATLELLLQRHPDDLAARKQLARDLEKAGRTPLALAQLEQLVLRDPRRTSVYLLDQVQLLTRQRQDRALVRERLERLRRLPPGDADTWRDVARGYRRIDDASGAADCLIQALRLEPEDGPAHLALAQLLISTGRRAEAAQRFRLAWKHGDEEVRLTAAKGLYAMLSETRELQGELRRLRVVSRRDPFDAETPRLLAQLSMLDGDVSNGVRVLGDMLRREGDDPLLLRQRVVAYVELGRSGSAMADLRTLVELGEDVDGLIGTLTARAIEAGDVGRAMELGYLTRSPADVARQFRSADRERSALDFLRRYERRQGSLDGPTRLLLAELYIDRGEPRQALRVLEAYEAEVGPDWRISRRIGDLHHSLRDRRRALEYGRRMLAQGAPPYVLEQYFESKADREELTRLRTRELLEPTTDARTLEAGLRELSSAMYDAPLALDLLRRLRGRAARARRLPEGFTQATWNQYLDGWTLRFYDANRSLVKPRLEQLIKRRYALDADEWAEYLWLDHLLPKEKRPRMFEPRRGSRVVGSSAPSAAERAVERFPADPRVLFAAARWTELEGRPSLALDLYGSLIAMLSTPEAIECGRDCRRAVLERYSTQVLALAPPHPGLEPGSELLLRLARLTHRPRADPGRRSLVPDLDGARVHRSRSLGSLGRWTEARATLEALEPLHPEALLARLDRAQQLVEVGLARAGLTEVLQVARRRAQLAEHPDLATFGDWQRRVDEALGRVVGVWIRRQVLWA
jgi:tetratricopeptide (TPR) repeat protein